MENIFHRVSIRKYEDKPVEKADPESRYAGAKCM